jgi:hypothetical protein
MDCGGNLSIEAMTQDVVSDKKFSISLHEGEIPESAKSDMERLYRNTFSSVVCHHVAEKPTNTCIVRIGSDVVDVFLFRVERHTVVVLNSVIRLVPQHVERFLLYVFDYYADVRIVKFVSVRAEAAQSRFPMQRFASSEDIVLALPASVAAYHAQLGKTAVKRFQYYEKKLRKDFPDFRYDVLEGRQIDGHIVAEIIALRAARADARGTESGVDRAEAAWIERAVGMYGFLGIASIDGKLCAGAICTRIDGDFFIHLVAHDSRYDPYSLGILNSYLTVCAAIVRGGNEFHFLWGSGAWKYKLLGVDRRLDDIVIYRSRIDCVRCAGTVMSGWYRDHARRLKRRLMDSSGFERFMRPCLKQWKRARSIGRRRAAVAAPEYVLGDER